MWHRVLAGLLKALVPLVILAVAVPYAYQLYTTGPVAERKARERVPRLVEVTEVHPGLSGPVIEAWGEVVPARTLILRPEVGGQVIDLNPALTAGGEIDAGEMLFRIDDRALKLAIAEAEADIAEIKARILIEEGQGIRARRDAERSGLQLTESQRILVMREPQMAQLQAELAAAEATRDQAILDLSKAEVSVPVDMLVMSEELARGGSITAGDDVAELVALDAFHVSVAVPAGALEWIDLNDRGIVRLNQPDVWPDGVYREGRIVRRGATLSQTGRMVEVIVEVADPMSHREVNADEPRLLLGSYLRVEFEGRPVANAVDLDRNFLRENGKVWVMTPDNTLDVRDVEIAWRGADRVLISSGLEPGERVVTTNLAISAPGMKLRVAEPADDKTASVDARPADGGQVEATQ
ncbi:efflux RND transporter periplasmic adaptor subunit [Rhodobacteraceae bacterium NNCM2]|nr:efflux RND transporter periplasmic adaptor subunit [Coraliihabitans acroporae]